MIVASIPITFKNGRAADLLGHMTETGREYEFVPDITLPEGCSAAIEIVKPDGMFVISECSIVEGNIIVTLPPQALAVRGLAHYIIRITTADDKIIFSAAGSIWVDDALITNELLENISEVYGLVFPDDFLTEADLSDYAKKSDVPQIEANPAGAADYDLNKLKLNNVIYKIPDAAVTKTATGNPIEISDGANTPLVKCITQITGYQSGTGTPSPTNIRPITAYTEGKIEVSDGDGNTTTHTTTYPSAIYRGSEDVVNGEVTDEWPVIDLGDLTWNISNNIFYASVTGLKRPSTTGEKLNAICSHYEIVTQAIAPSITEECISGLNWIDGIALWNSNYTTGAEVKAAMTGVKMAFQLATPTTSSVTPTNLPIKSLNGYSHIESSTGDMEIEYITAAYEPLIGMRYYSSVEHVIGRWIDGRPVYQKSFHFAIPLNNHVTVATSINNFDMPIKYEGIVALSTGIFEDICFSRPDSGSSTYYTAVTSTGDFFFKTYEAAAGTAYITMRYLKQEV